MPGKNEPVDSHHWHKVKPGGGEGFHVSSVPLW